MKTINGRSYPTYDEIKDAQRQLAADSNCNRDHCTPEERAVIEAVNKFYETPERPKPRFIGHDCDTAHCTDRERDLLDALLATRVKK